MKEIFDNYRENPSEDVWRRLNERLDAEMPVSGSLDRRSRRKSWIWAAAAVAVLVIGGLAFFTLVRHNAGDGQNIAQVQKQPEKTQATTSDAPVVEPETAQVEVGNSEAESPAKVNPARKVSKTSGVKTPSAPVNIEQQSNSESKALLAKQLTEDPVLQTLSPDMVEWSAPVHLSIPNTFSPNKDSDGDFFVIDGVENYSSPKLVVQDKDNRVVYQSDDYNNSWNGENCPDGVYSYELTYSYNGIENQASGKVRIMRN